MLREILAFDRFNWNLARAFYSLNILSSLIGIVFNFVIVLTTIKTKSLRSTCNLLIAICAIGDMFHQMGILAQFPLLLDIYLEIDSDMCNVIMFLPEMGMAIGGTSVLCIGLDRMIAVMFPIRYKTFDKRFYYLIGVLSICFAQWFNLINLAVNIASALVYSITWMGLRKQSDPTMMKKIGRSLFIVVAVDFTGWVLTPGTIIFMYHLDLNAAQLFAWKYMCTIFISVSLSVKLLIYYYTSSDYRSAFNFLFFNNSSKKSTSVRTVTSHS